MRLNLQQMWMILINIMPRELSTLMLLVLPPKWDAKQGQIVFQPHWPPMDQQRCAMQWIRLSNLWLTLKLPFFDPKPVHGDSSSQKLLVRKHESFQVVSTILALWIGCTICKRAHPHVQVKTITWLPSMRCVNRNYTNTELIGLCLIACPRIVTFLSKTWVQTFSTSSVFHLYLQVLMVQTYMLPLCQGHVHYYWLSTWLSKLASQWSYECWLTLALLDETLKYVEKGSRHYTQVFEPVTYVS